MNEPWRISLLGGLRIEGSQTTITRFNSQKTAGLLAYLAYHLRHMQAREILIDLFWPDGTPEAGRHSLSVALSTLRNQLEPPGLSAGSVILADRYSVGLNPAAVTTDVAEFEAAIKAAAKKTVSTVEQSQLLSQALDLYQGRLLPGYYEDWITGEQERLSGLFFDATSQLLTHLETIGDISAALSYARKAVSVDPLREEAHQAQMRLLVAAGQPGAALRQYKELERLLEEEMGEEPSAPLRALARQIEKEAGLSLPAFAPPGRSAPSSRPSVLPSAVGQSPLPVTLTFLLTDIEGSTRLWEQVGDAFKQALETHHTLLRAEFARFGGQEIKEAGDPFLVAFGSARQALECAIACQQALMEQHWREETGAIAVRMALHTGDAEFKDGDYHGLVLHRASRMLTAANGGQILLAEPTAALVRRDLDENAVRLVDLGVYRLRDVPTPERLFQADYPGMRQVHFPPLAAETGHAAALPLRFTRFFGRVKEIAELTELLLTPEVRLVTITGLGGIGKTRLSLEAAEQMVDAFAGAVYFAPLADITDPRLIAGSVLDALRIPRSPSREPIDQVVEALSKQPSLLVLDNLEQIVEGGAEVVQELLSRVVSLTLLVTSRQLLGLAAEREFALSPLPTPGNGDAPEQLSVYESVRLFVDRAQAVKPDFQVSSANAPAVAELVTRLEGIPLAIELAAARAQILTPMQMLTQLDQRFGFLVSRKRDVAERHRTLQAAVDWSYRLLSPELQRFFARLSVFRGGWTVEAAETVCEEPLALDYLAQLIECSLVLTEESDAGMRFRMLETLREYAEEKLAESREAERIRESHQRFYLALSEEAEPQLQGPKQAVWLDRLETELDNLRKALDGEDRVSCLRIGVALWWFWYVRGYYGEGRSRLNEALRQTREEAVARIRARAQYGAGVLARNQGDYASARTLYEESSANYRELEDSGGIAGSLNGLGEVAQAQGDYGAARTLFEESLMLRRELGNRGGMATSLNSLGSIALSQGDYASARTLHEESLALSRELEDRGGIADSLNRLGHVASSQKDYAAAKTLYEESLAIYRELGNKCGISASLNNLGNAAADQGDNSTARTLYEESLTLFRELGDRDSLAGSLLNLGIIACEQGDYASARTLYSESLTLFRDLGNRWGITLSLEGIASLSTDWEQEELATQIWGAAALLRENLGAPLPPNERDKYDRQVAAARAALGEETFSAAWEAGRAMTLDQAVAYALAEGTS